MSARQENVDRDGVDQQRFPREACDDCGAERLKANGFVPLAISPNYYDDLEARFGLAPELADRLRQNNILYDRDADGGEYFQFYSRTYGEGFFFEILERRCGYNGYGAPNAPFRIAAQKRAIRPKGMPAR